MKSSRNFWILLTILVCLSLSAGAAEKISVWLTGHINEEMNIIKEITETAFTAKTGIAVEYTNLSAASGDAPDVGGAGALFLPELGLRGALMDLSQMPGFADISKRSYPGFYRSLQYKNMTFGIPYTATVSTAFQRDDLLNALGIKSIDTWDELRQVLPKLQAKNSNVSLQWFMSETLYADVNMFMWQRGADDYNADLTKSGYDTPECITAFRDYVELYTKHKIPKDIPILQALINGDLAMTIQYPNFFQNLTVSSPQLAGKWSMVQVPGYNVGGKLNRTSTGGGSAVGIFDSSKKKTQAWEFIKWLTDETTQLEISNRVMNQIKGTIFLPSIRGGVNKIPIDSKAAQVFENALNVATSSIYGLVAPRHRRRYLQMAAQKAILNGENPEKAIRDAAEEHNSEIKKKQVEYDRFIKKLLDKKK